MKITPLKIKYELFSLLSELIPSRRLVHKKLALGATLLAMISCDESTNPNAIDEKDNEYSFATCYDTVEVVTIPLQVQNATFDTTIRRLSCEVTDTIPCFVKANTPSQIAYIITDVNDTILQSGIFNYDIFRYDTLIILESEKYSKNEEYDLFYHICNIDDTSPIETLIKSKQYNTENIRLIKK